MELSKDELPRFCSQVNQFSQRSFDKYYVIGVTDVKAKALLEPDSKAYALASRLRPNWIAARVTKAARVSARFS